MADIEIQRLPESRKTDAPVLPTTQKSAFVPRRHEADEQIAIISAEIPAGCVHELFEQYAARNPHAIAVICEDEIVTYEELNCRANHFAHSLQTIGVALGTMVAILLERSIDLVIAELAILKCGAAYVPLDPAFPSERIAFMIVDSDAKVVVTLSSMEPPELPAVMRTNIDQLGLSGMAVDNLGAIGNEAMAYMMYTSGSTGRPKGVIVPHGAITRLVLNNGFLCFQSSDRVAFAVNPAFDVSTFEVWGPLLNGSSIVVIKQEILFNPVQLGEMLKQLGVTCLWLTVGLFNQYSELLGEYLPGLRYLLTGGDILDPQIVARTLRRNAPQHFLSAYGPTETTTFATIYEITSVPEGALRIPIGREIANRRIYILDGNQEQVPMGVMGELYIGGDGVACGYWNRPELTAERFICDPFAIEKGARMYRTGDLGSRRADGNIEFLGRSDMQVKLRGFRIELGEIETRLAEYPGMREAAVLVREDTPGDKKLVAYYAFSQSGEKQPVLKVEQMRSYMSTKLPEYMVPAAYVRMESFPLTANGKLDRKALPAPTEDAYRDSSYEPPRNEMELRVAKIWAEVLKLDRVGRHDNFFELGGHSLCAITLMERMRAEGIVVDVRMLFEMPTIAELLATTTGKQDVVIPPNLIPENCDAITPQMLSLIDLKQEEIDRVVKTVVGGARNVQEIYPLAPLQEGILFHHLLDGEGDPYLLAGLLSFDNRTRLETYLQAMQAVIDRHDILRTAVAWEELREPVQVVWKKAPLITEEVKLQETDDGDPAEQMYARFNPRQYRIDIRQAPLLRVYLAQDLGHNRWLMVLLMHHLIGDHTTVEVMQEEIHAHLFGQADQLSPPLPFRNLVAEARLGFSEKEHEAFFRKMLGDVMEGTFPFGLKNVRGDGKGVEEARVLLDQRLAQRIRKQAQGLAVSAASICHLAWARVVVKLSGRDDVVFGTVLFGRMQGAAVADRAMGLFINTLPIRLQTKDKGAKESVRQTHSLLTDLLRHEHASLMLAQRCSGVIAPAPLFSALLNYAHTPQVLSSLPEKGLLELKAWEGMEWLISEERSNYPFTLTVDDFGEGFGLSAQTAAGIDPQRVCEYMHTSLMSLVEALEEEPDRPVCKVEVLPAREREQILYEWNNPAANSPFTQSACELFNEQAKKSPDVLAVVDGDLVLSYGELNRQANQLAHFLRCLGVKPEAPVAVCSEASVETVLALLAVLKAGGAYIVLDSSFSSDRLCSLVKDCEATVLLTQSCLKERFGELPLSLPIVDLSNASLWENQPETSPERAATWLGPEQLACITYAPSDAEKLNYLMLTHRNIVQLVRTVDYAQFDLQDVIEQVHQPAPAAAVFEIWSALLSSRTLTRVAGEGFAEAPGTARMMRQNRITTVFSSTLQLNQMTCGEDVPIIRQAPNARLYLLDCHEDPAAIGVEGDLYAGGAGLMRGYLNDAEMTAERFIPDPFCAETGERMYRTGDMGKWRGNGEIEFLEQSCEELLSVPKATAEQEKRYEAPQGEIETIVAGIWAEVLKVERVGREDNFFVLGGRSLMAVQMASRVRQVLEVELRIQDIFERLTLRELAEQIINLKLNAFDSSELTELLKEMQG
ncbi:MAG TPA: amino acid adenylation domain-containing protein [Candidatus Angelobacter sp.]|nr:amino acid adenylation domain-containing protein [Candidatus Angelobacter sp.]